LKRDSRSYVPADKVTDHKFGLSKKNFREGGLSVELADQMIENCIGMLSLPLGLGLNFVVNGQDYIIPMVVEEPSVIAAVSNSAKIIKEAGGGFKTWSSEPLMIGQIQILDVDPEAAKLMLEQKREIIIGRHIS
jgi:degradative hydroxymethylglutaryl-CoA reductase